MHRYHTKWHLNSSLSVPPWRCLFPLSSRCPLSKPCAKGEPVRVWVIYIHRHIQHSSALSSQDLTVSGRSQWLFLLSESPARSGREISAATARAMLSCYGHSQCSAQCSSCHSWVPTVEMPVPGREARGKGRLK